MTLTTQISFQALKNCALKKITIKKRRDSATCIFKDLKILKFRDHIAQKNCLFSVQCCLKPLGQHRTRILPVLCCPKSIRTTLNRTFSCAMLSRASLTTLRKDFTCVMLSQEY